MEALKEIKRAVQKVNFDSDSVVKACVSGMNSNLMGPDPSMHAATVVAVVLHVKEASIGEGKAVNMLSLPRY